MSSVTLLWVGDLNQDKRLQNTPLKESDEKHRPKIIELKDGQKEIKIGRLNSTNPPNYLIESCINKRMISRNHATIERRLNGGFMLYDNSMNGTYINYTRVSGGVTLKHGDIVCFGHLNGANLKPGENVAPFFSDLKYQVYLNSSSHEKEISSDTGGSRKRALKSNPPENQESLSGNEDSYDVKSRRTPVSSSKQKTNSAHKLRRIDSGDNKNTDEDDDDDLLTPSKRKSSSNIKLKKFNGERINSLKKHPPLQVSPPPSSHIKKSSSKLTVTGSHQHSSIHSSKDKRQSQPRPSSTHNRRRFRKNSFGEENDIDGEVDSSGELFHYDTEECSARPCKQPQENSIDWIQCDKCSKWYHQICLGLRSSEANVDVYFCPYCKKT